MNWLDLSASLLTSDLSPVRSDRLYAKISSFIADRIESGELSEGARLPTNRELAALLSVDRSTVARAYAELSEQGLIESWVGRGTFVKVAQSRLLKLEPLEDHAIIWPDRFSRASRTIADIMSIQPPATRLSSDMVSFAAGMPTEEFYPSAELKQMVGAILSSSKPDQLFDYSPAEGHASLRCEVLKHLKEQGIEAGEDELLIVSGSQQAIDLVTDVLVDPGDAVMLEEPSYFWAICNLRSHQARCIPISVDAHGIDVDSVERELARNSVKLIYVMPSFQNPTGAELSMERRLRLLEVARRHSVPILEDNFVGDLRYDGQPLASLRALPGGRDVVIHQGTFSKALCPGLRLGWLLAPREVLSRLVLAKRVCDLSTNSMAQLTLAYYLRAGLYAKHLERVRSAYKSRRDAMISALSKWFPPTGGRFDVSWSRPHGGLFIWCRLPFGMSAREFLTFAEKENVTFSPGDLFFLSGDRREFLRLGFIQTSETLIFEGVKRLASAYQKYSQALVESSGSAQDAVARTREQVLI